jgi:hypothetical protein
MKCRPDDLALILRSGNLHENVGRFVIVERRAVEGEVLAFIGRKRVVASPGADWVVRPVHGTLTGRGRTSGKLYQLPLGSYKDKDLLPIRPEDPDQADTTDTSHKEVA